MLNNFFNLFLLVSFGFSLAMGDSEKPKEKSIEREIEFCNKTTQDDITYDHWSGRHTPEFAMEVEGTPIGLGETKKIKIKEDGNCKVTFKYDFRKGYKTGGETYTFNLVTGAEKSEVKFLPWKEQKEGSPKLQLTNATNLKEVH